MHAAPFYPRASVPRPARSPNRLVGFAGERRRRCARDLFAVVAVEGYQHTAAASGDVGRCGVSL